MLFFRSQMYPFTAELMQKGLLGLTPMRLSRKHSVAGDTTVEGMLLA